MRNENFGYMSGDIYRAEPELHHQKVKFTKAI